MDRIRAFVVLTSLLPCTSIDRLNSRVVTASRASDMGCTVFDMELQERVEAVKAFLAAGGAQRCDLKRINAKGLSWKEFNRRQRGRAAVLSGLQVSLPSNHASATLWSRSSFLERFGHQRIKTNNGHFDHIRAKEITTIGEYLQTNTSTSNIFLADAAYSLYTDVAGAVGVPEPALLEGFGARPILSLGVTASSTRFHKHAETWQYLLAGRKAWWLTTNDRLTLPGRGGDPCTSLVASKRHPSWKELVLCVQHPGEAVYFGNQTPHATCNLEAFTLGVGAQGHMEGWPSLHRAARLNDTGLVQRAIEEVGDVDALDAENSTALHRAVAGRHLAVAALLVGAGASLRRRDGGGKHALIAAAERGDLPLVKFLVDAGAPIRRPDTGGAQAVHWTTLSGHVPVLKYILARGASLNATDKRGTQPIHWAALESDTSTLGFIISRRGDVNAMADDGIRPIHWAAGVGHVPMVSQLVVARAAAFAGDKRGTTALHFAAAQNRVPVVRCLLAARANLLTIGSGQGGLRPLHVAAGMGHAAAVETLLHARAPVEAADTSKRRAIHAACEAGHTAAAAALAKFGRANMVAVDVQGRQPAHLAASAGHVAMLQELHARGVQLHTKDGHGKAPLDLAEVSGHKPAAVFLRHTRHEMRKLPGSAEL